MLRLEKGKNREIRVSVRNRKSHFNRTLLYASGIALGIHLAGVLFFRVQTSLDTDQEALSATVVESSLLVPIDDSHSVTIGEKKSIHPHYLEPPLYNPHLPELTHVHLMHPLDPFADKKIRNPFFNVEADRLEASLYEPFQKSEQPRIQVHIAGELADIPILFNGIDTTTMASFEILGQSDSDQSALFTVQVENRTGRVFWYTQQRHMESQAFTRFAEKIIEAIRFKSILEGFVTTGEIEVTIPSPHVEWRRQ